MAIDIACDILFNGYSNNYLELDGNLIYSLTFEDLVGLYTSSDRLDTVIEEGLKMVDTAQLSTFINTLLDDLADFTAEDVKLDKKSNSILVLLPQPKVLSFIMPLDEAKLEYESVSTLRSDFTTEDRMNFLKQGEENILADVENLGILHDAEKNATLFFESLFASLGVEEVKITFKEEK